MEMLVKRLSETAIIPTKAHPGDAGWDLYADKDVLIAPGETVVIPTGIAIQPLNGETSHETIVNLVWDRSSLGSKGIHRLAGVIDIGYNGEVFVCLTNLCIAPVLFGLEKKPIQSLMLEHSFHINRGDKIAQMVTQKVVKSRFVIVDNLSETDRGTKCLGSSNIK